MKLIKSLFTQNNILVKPFYWIFIYFKLAIERFLRNHGFMRSSSLAYSLFLSLIPVLASMSLFVSKLYKINKNRIDLFLNEKEINTIILKFLPYSSNEINTYITGFINNAMTIGGIGFIILLIYCVGLIMTLENIFNITWNKQKGRAIYKNIFMVFFICISFAITFSLSVKLNSLNIIQKYTLIKIPGKIISFGLLILSFSFLYKFIPSAKIKIRSALIGGTLAAALYYFARIFFKLYTNFFFAFGKIYGSLGLIPIFIISFFMFSIILILGAEMSYVAQNYKQCYYKYIKDKQYKIEGDKIKKLLGR